MAVDGKIGRKHISIYFDKTGSFGGASSVKIVAILNDEREGAFDI